MKGCDNVPTGSRIKEIRKQKGLTQKQLGEKCGMYESQIRKYENGKANPKIETLKKIAAALEVPVSLLDDTLSFMEDMETTKSRKILAYTVINELYNRRKQDLLNAFEKLNSKGQIESVKRVQELTEIPRYTEPDKD